MAKQRYLLALGSRHADNIRRGFSTTLIDPHRSEHRKQRSKPDEVVQSIVFHGDTRRLRGAAQMPGRSTELQPLATDRS
jgi:hypothetical protein